MSKFCKISNKKWIDHWWNPL